MTWGILFKSDFVTVDTVPARTPQGIKYDHTRVTPRSPYGGIVIPFYTEPQNPFFGRRQNLHLGFVRQFRPVIGHESLEFPRGATADLGSEEAARELVEELGLSSAPLTLTPIGRLRPDTGLLSTEVGVWAVRLSPEDVKRSQNYEEEFSGARPEWHGHESALKQVAEGAITCGMTLAALAMFRSHEKALLAATPAQS